MDDNIHKSEALKQDAKHTFRTYRDASLIILYLVVLRIFKLPGKAFRIATVSKSYLTVIVIIMKSLKSIEKFNMSKLTQRANRYGRTGRPQL